MVDRIHVNSFRALEDLEGAIGRFSSRFTDVLEQAERNIARKRRMIDGVLKERERIFSYWQREYDLYEYADLDQRSPNLPPALASRELGGVVDALVGTAENVADSDVSIIEYSVDALSTFLLPRGFQWTPLDRIDPIDLETLPNDNEFKKMTKEDMIAGMELLLSRILPDIQRNPNAIGSDYFGEIDQQEGRTGANSLRNVYDAFFGGERIRLEPTCEEYYRIDHGRHRIKLALELGWSMVPVSLRPTGYLRN